MTAYSVILSDWLYIALVVLYMLTILSVIGVVISENRNPVKSLAWVTVLLVVPVFGLILYIVFGRSLKNKRYITKRNRRKLKRHEPARSFNPSRSGLSPESAQQVKLGQSLMSAPYYEGNEVKYFDSGREKFEWLFNDIRQARSFIYLQYYILSDDKIGTELADLLIQKAGEGLKIKIIYDHVGSFKTRNRYFKRLREAGVEVYPFFKVSFPFLGSRINWRNHRKIVLIDGNIGYIGGMNVADRYVDDGKFGYWRDAHLRIKGPILRSINHSFCADWNFMGRAIPDDFNPDSCPAHGRENGMQLVTSGPVGPWSNIGLIYLKAIGNAKKSIFLQTPYFLPTEGLLRALQAAALAKIDVRLMIPYKPDSIMLRYASFSYIKDCLQSGIKVYLYEPGMLHSKTLIVDDEFVSVGSTNFDFRSFEHNFECNLFIYSKEFNATMTESFIADQQHCRRVLPYEWSHRPIAYKIKESLMRLLAPVL